MGASPPSRAAIPPVGHRAVARGGSPTLRPVSRPDSHRVRVDPGAATTDSSGADAQRPSPAEQAQARSLLEDLATLAPDTGDPEAQRAVEDALAAAYERVSSWT